MLTGLITFLIGALIVIVVLAVVRIVMRKIPMDGDVQQIVWLIVGLIALIFLIALVCSAFQVGPADLRWR